MFLISPNISVDFFNLLLDSSISALGDNWLIGFIIPLAIKEVIADQYSAKILADEYSDAIGDFVKNPPSVNGCKLMAKESRVCLISPKIWVTLCNFVIISFSSVSSGNNLRGRIIPSIKAYAIPLNQAPTILAAEKIAKSKYPENISDDKPAESLWMNTGISLMTKSILFIAWFAFCKSFESTIPERIGSIIPSFKNVAIV